jgi:YD repeat-containing protein
MALGTATSFEFSSLQGQLIKAQHFYDVRTAVNAVRAVANLSAATWSRQSLAGLFVQANDVQEMRNKLDEALTALSITVTAYQDPTLSTGANGTIIQAIHIEQLQARSTRGSSTSSGPLDADYSTARVDPLNETGGGGENPLSRNFNWNLSLLSLPGRAGLDLGLTLSYNSLVWTRVGTNTIAFDKDGGFPGAGFRLGFPVIEPSYFDTAAGKDVYLLIGSDGSRTELRQVTGSTTLYEAADSSHLLFDTSSSSMILRTTNGTQLNYSAQGGEYKCTQIKDRNGNYISVSYTQAGQINTITDTLNRVITFEYTSGLLTAIKQTWNQNSQSPLTHYWARFEYAGVPIHFNFGTMAVLGLTDNSTPQLLSRVRLADNSYFDFSYSSWGQVYKVSSYAADNTNHLLNYRFYNLPQTAGSIAYDDCPRFTELRDWAQYWNGDTDGTPAANEEALTQFAIPTGVDWTMPGASSQVSGTLAQVTAPDGTSNKIYFIGTAGTATGWQRGLTALVNTYDSAAALQRQVMTTWTQDNTAVSYLLNPRVTETNIYDPAGNRARVQMTYQQFTFTNGTSCQLPIDTYEYAADATTKLRSTRTDYNTSTSYTDRRILGLVSERRLYAGDVNNGGALKVKVGFNYDESGSIQGNDAPVQHDTNYNSNFVIGRANLSSMKRYDVTNISQFTTTSTKYNTAGSVVSSKDASAVNHEVTVSYADSFSDGITTHNTLAYPTKLTDPDGYYSISTYNFDFGSLTYQQTPPPNFTGAPPTAQPAGPEQTFEYYDDGRLKKQKSLVNNAYTRFEYPTSSNRVDTYTTIQDGLGEAHSFKITDGAGRIITTATDNPGSVGLFSGQRIVYDVMGRVIKTSNPTETSASGAPLQWTATGDDAAAGWVYTQQTYDWKGRPLVTTNQDGTTKTASYAGCGCAGGEVVTLTDEGTIDAGVAKRRQQRIYSDVLGRKIKTEILNWEGGSVYSAVVNTYNERDQITNIRQFDGPEGSSTYQDTSMTYDGYGRLSTKHLPQQQVDPNNSASSDHTTWQYNADDTVAGVTDPRGATTTYSYNARHLPNVITYALSGSSTIVESFAYDAAGNRTFRSDGAGSTSYQYDQLSRLTSETQQFNGMAGSYQLTYQYNLAGQLTSFTYPNFSTSYTYDAVGRTKTVTGPPRWTGITQYVSDIQYRASGGYKSISYGSGTSLSVDYNARLKLQSYKIQSVYNNQWYDSAHVEPQYYADGSLRSTQDFIDPRFSRSFSFDHVGSLRQAGSGVYNQTFQHDAFGNITNRESGIWTEWEYFSATWINGRNQNQAWHYDASGNVRFDDNFEYTYDAKGQNTKLRKLSDNLWISQIDNAEGQMIKRSTGDATSTFSTTFYLRSTVLGGKVVAEYNSAAQQQKRYTYLNGQLLGTDDPPNFYLEHTNPLTASRGQSFWAGVSGVYDPTSEPDSSGIVDVGFSDPNDVPPPPPEEPDIASILPGANGQCRVEGMQSEFGCYLALRLLAGGSAVRCPNDDCNARLMTVTHTIGGEIKSISKFWVTAGDPGWDGSLDGTYGWGPHSWFDTISNFDLSDPDQAKKAVSQIPEIQKNPEYPKRVGSQRPPGPVSEKIGWLTLGAIFGHLKAIAERGRCQEFLTKLLQRAGDDGNDKPVHTDILDLFVDVAMQRGFFTQKEVNGRGFSTVDGAVGAPGGAEVRLSNGSNDFKGKLRLEYFAYDALSELTHVAGSKPSGYATGAFSDYHLAKIALDVANEMGTGVKNLKLTLPTDVDPNNDPFGKWSNAYHGIVSLYCKRQERF